MKVAPDASQDLENGRGVFCSVCVRWNNSILERRPWPVRLLPTGIDSRVLIISHSGPVGSW